MTEPHMRADHSASNARWRQSVLFADATLTDAIRCLDESGSQISLITSPDGRLVGTVTDGDIRRGLLRGLSMQSSVNEIVYREPFVVPPQMGRDTVLLLMHANKMRQLPVVDENRQLVGLHLWDELITPPSRSNLMVIMAGGQGARLRPHTDNCPKPLLPVGGKPMLEHIIERARSAGFNHFVLAVHFLGHMIRDHFGDGSKWQIQIDYVEEERPLGTAGAIRLIEPRPTTPFVVSNGDVLTDIRYDELLDFHLRNGAVATMAVRLYEWQHPFGVVHTKGVDIIGFEEKPVSRSHINAGIYVLDPRALDELPAGERCDMPTLFTRLHEGGARTIVYPMHEPWLDVGREEDLRKANNLP